MCASAITREDCHDITSRRPSRWWRENRVSCPESRWSSCWFFPRAPAARFPSGLWMSASSSNSSWWDLLVGQHRWRRRSGRLSGWAWKYFPKIFIFPIYDLFVKTLSNDLVVRGGHHLLQFLQLLSIHGPAPLQLVLPFAGHLPQLRLALHVVVEWFLERTSRSARN